MKNCRCSDYGVAHCLCSSRLNSQLFCEIYNVVTILSRTVCCQSALVLKLLACTASVTESMQFSYDEGTEYIYIVFIYMCIIAQALPKFLRGLVPLICNCIYSLFGMGMQEFLVTMPTVSDHVCYI